MRRVYQGSERVIHFSMLTLIHRAMAEPGPSNDCLSQGCVEAAHEALEKHQECVEALRACTDDASVLTKYINWHVSPSISML